MDLKTFLLEKGYKVENLIETPKGRGKFQYSCLVDKKPNDDDMREYCEKRGMIVLKNNFKKGREMTLLMKKEVKEEKREIFEERKDIDLNMIVEMIYDKDLTREELRDKLNMFQTSAYTKGFNAHKLAMEKLLGTEIKSNNPFLNQK